MTNKELYEKISDAAFSYRRAAANVAFPAPHVERMKNILFNNLGEIEEALKYAAEAEKQIHVLTVEIESADAELKEKDDEIAALKKQKKQTTKAKKPDVEQDTL